ncbi:hypothetical protein ACGFRG_05385 [Streptomyces sp. NPDC048696]|uniref:hypothetical protein n=1 Tax=Streptomyces sp. NPDC048696 TaxID=3365585 RepID=UPI003720C22A
MFGHTSAQRTLFAELKTDTGHIRPAQREWLKHLAACGLETALWRPEDLPLIVATLAPGGPRAQITNRL